MSTISSRNQLIIGLPESGKTTFLAALWHVVTSEEVIGALRLAQLHGNNEYLNELHSKWISSLPLGRTIQGSEELEIRMRLKTWEGEETTELTFPDMSGEAFRHLWEERQWEQHYDEVARSATGGLLFIHPNLVEHPARIAEITVPETGEADEGAGGTGDSFIVWHASHSPTSVKLVELLQFFAHDPDIYNLKRVAVIISAWDVVRENIAPEEWLARRLPLFDQFLKANKGRLDYQVYGISAQGGDIETEADRLRRPINQAERITVIGNNCSEHDITAPVKWVADL